ncbi:MAG TPA: thermonuclease family protein [Planctomycetota bacterium]|nr:thermonuclease family protein [Planctomycetota bacterium]
MRTVLIVCSYLLAAALGFGLCYWKFVPAQSPKTLHLDITDGGIYRVRSVVDGDTIVLENGLHLRYNGMNAPETMRWYKDYSPMSKEATAKNIELVEGKRIRLKLGTDPIDMHGRVVANIFVVPDDPNQPEIEVRELMVKQGFAKAMGLGVSKEEFATIKSWENEAKAAEVGIWGVKNEVKLREEAKLFCASSNSKIYHRSECNIAKRISAANLHEYATAEEAEAVGLKPCATCLGRKK